MKDPDTVWPYANPPLNALLVAPLTALPYPIAAWLWAALNVVLLAGGCVLLLAAVGRLDWLGVALALALVAGFYAATVALRLGQVEIVQFALLAGTLYLLKRGTPAGAGVTLGAAIGLKLFPAAMGVFLLWKRQWKAAAWAFGAGAVLLAGPVLLVGLDRFGEYLQTSSVYTFGPFTAFPYNQSLNGFWSRTFKPNLFAPTLFGLDLPGLAVALWLGCAGALTAALAWLSRRPVPVAGLRLGRFDLEYGAAVLVLLLALPHSQIYSFVWLLIPLLVFGLFLLDDAVRLWWGLVWGAMAYVALGRQWLSLPPAPARLVQSHVFLGTVALTALAGVLLIVQARAQRVPVAPAGAPAGGEL
jgi:hypothetical protein